MTTDNALYDNIEEMPITVWHEILKTGRLSLLYKKGKGPLGKKIKQVLKDLWLNLEQQYYDEFGIDVDFEIRIDKQRELAELNLEWIETGNRKLLNRIRDLEQQIEMWGKQISIKFYDLVDRIQGIRKYQINIKEMTVVAWYWMLKNVAKEARKKPTHGT